MVCWPRSARSESRFDRTKGVRPTTRHDTTRMTRTTQTTQHKNTWHDTTTHQSMATQQSNPKWYPITNTSKGKKIEGVKKNLVVISSSRCHTPRKREKNTELCFARKSKMCKTTQQSNVWDLWRRSLSLTFVWTLLSLSLLSRGDGGGLMRILCQVNLWGRRSSVFVCEMVF